MKITMIQNLAYASVLIGALLSTGCSESTNPVKAKDKAAPATSADIDPRSKVVGVVPAGPTPEAPATTSTAKSDISKAQQSTAMPLPGQANDHSTLSPKATQKSTPPAR